MMRLFQPARYHCRLESSKAVPKLTGAGIWRDEGGGSCGDLWPDEDVVSEVVEAPDQIARGSRPRLLIKEGLSEFLEGNSFGEHVEHGDQDLVRDGHGGPQGTPARLQPVVLVFSSCPWSGRRRLRPERGSS